jgi:hypothetical protein
MLEKKLQEAVNRYREINKYSKKMIMEQDALPTPEEPIGDVPPVEDTPAVEPPVDSPEPPALTEPESTEEIDITDLVNMTKSIKNDIDNNKEDHSQVVSKMDDVFTKLSDLEQKLSQMDSVISKIDMLGQKIETIKEPTPQEKLEMRSLDSYPFNQSPQQFFTSKQGEMQATGKNEYVLTKDEIDGYSPDTIKKSFNPEESEDEFKF